MKIAVNDLVTRIDLYKVYHKPNSYFSISLRTYITPIIPLKNDNLYKWNVATDMMIFVFI